MLVHPTWPPRLCHLILWGLIANHQLHVAGTKGRSDALSLDKSLHDDFEKGHTDEYTVEAMDVGEILLLQLHSDGGGWWYKNPDWFVNKIAIIAAKNNESYEFPCNRWVLKDLKVFQGKGKNILQRSFPWLFRLLFLFLLWY